MKKPAFEVFEFTGEGKPVKELISDKEIEGKDRVLKYLNFFEADCAAAMSLKDEITGKELVGRGVLGYEDDRWFWDTSTFITLKSTISP